MADDWDDAPVEEKKTDPIKEQVSKHISADDSEKDILFSDDEVEAWAKAGSKASSKICCLVYGADGTGKTGIVYDYFSKEDAEAGKQLWVIDLDGGGLPLKDSYHKDKGENLVIIDPLVTFESDKGTQIDYLKTFAKVRAIVRFVKNNWHEKNIKALVFDGLSTALTYAEQQMRIDKHLDVDGGVQLRYWLQRNKIFLETLEQIRSLPVAKFFIAHENFIMGDKKDGKVSSVVAKTNAMMIQKIKCARVVSPTDVNFTATIDKSKYNVTAEGQSFDFCKVNKKDKSFEWNTKDIFEALIGGKEK